MSERPRVGAGDHKQGTTARSETDPPAVPKALHPAHSWPPCGARNGIGSVPGSVALGTSGGKLGAGVRAPGWGRLNLDHWAVHEV